MKKKKLLINRILLPYYPTHTHKEEEEKEKLKREMKEILQREMFINCSISLCVCLCGRMWPPFQFAPHPHHIQFFFLCFVISISVCRIFSYIHLAYDKKIWTYFHTCCFFSSSFFFFFFWWKRYFLFYYQICKEMRGEITNFALMFVRQRKDVE